MPTTPHFPAEFPTDSLIAAFVGRFPSASTRRNYRANLTDWFAWLAIAGVEPDAVGRGNVEAYTRHMERACHAPNTIYQHQSTVSSFSRWAVQEGYLVANPVDGVQRPRRSGESSANGLSRHEMTDWLDAAHRRGGSAYACACLLALNGLRVGELCAINVDDLGEQTWHHTLTLRAATTKGRKPAVIALAPRTVQAVAGAVDGRRSGPLLRNRDQRRMTPYNVAYLVRLLCAGIGVDRRITPHSLRHSAITIAWTRVSACATSKTSPATTTPRPPDATTDHATSSTATPPMPSPNTSPAATSHHADQLGQLTVS